MTGLIGFSILISGSWALLLIFILALAAFSYFIYKYTIPGISSGLRIFLVILRSIILALVLFLIFEPVLSLVQKEEMESKTYVYIDNSNSIAAKDSLKRLESTLSFIKDLNSTGGIRAAFFTFGKKIDSIASGETGRINLSESQTNISSVLADIRKKGSRINSAVILTDGIITDGIDPLYQAEKLQIPLFTVGIGDSSIKRDVQIYNILTNRVIYAGKPTAIEVTVRNTGFEKRNARISFFEENNFIESKDLNLSETGSDKIQFNYKPVQRGEKKLKVSVTYFDGEESSLNNSRVFFVNVLDTKLKICLIAGSPSADVSAISDAITTDKNIELKKLIQTSPTRFLNDANTSVADSADLFFLIDFPSSNTPQNLIDKISAALSRNKPFFFLLSGGVDLNRLNGLERWLPFSRAGITNEYLQVQPELNSEAFSTYFSTLSNRQNIWNNLPFVTQLSTPLAAKPGTNVLAGSKVRNIPIGNPLIVSKNLGGQRVFSILAGDIWRWRLQTAEKNSEFFDNFINDIVKWLNVSSNQKQFRVTTAKKIYSPGDEVEFTAELYDYTFAPVDTAKISARVNYNSKSADINFSPAGNGIYTSAFIPPEPGDFSYEGTAHMNGSALTSETGRFNVGEIRIERYDTRMRGDFLKLLSNSGGGGYYSIDNYDGLKDKLRRVNESSSKEIIRKSEYPLWSNEWILIAIIFLFAVEWFTRKRTGMI